MYAGASALAVGMKQTRAGCRRDKPRMKSSRSGLSGSMEKPPPPIATMCPSSRFMSSSLSAASRERQELTLIPFVDLRKRLVVARIEDRAMLEEFPGNHQRPAPIATWLVGSSLLFPARWQRRPQERHGECSPVR